MITQFDVQNDFPPRLLSPDRVKHVLVVEDDESIQVLLDRIIHSIDPEADVECISSGETALPKIQNATRSKTGPYDLIILDVFLEGKITGVELWDCADQESPQTPVLIVSSLPFLEFLRTIGQGAICPAFLEKPFRGGQCRQLIEGLLLR